MRRKGILITLLFLWIYLVGILCTVVTRFGMRYHGRKKQRSFL